MQLVCERDQNIAASLPRVLCAAAAEALLYSHARVGVDVCVQGKKMYTVGRKIK